MKDYSRHGFTDEQMLTIMHLRDHEKMTTTDIGKRFGKSKGSIIGLTNRIDRSMDETDPDGNQNGTMKPMWWKR